MPGRFAATCLDSACDLPAGPAGVVSACGPRTERRIALCCRAMRPLTGELPGRCLKSLSHPPATIPSAPGGNIW
ncbi:hypothetical protein B0G81_3706 [Paraburkholderia sp. BL6665CI2N2]|nr:hypothetical protein B0G81_3706 [Paraburkholderia sp. BL6665CI2N2]